MPPIDMNRAAFGAWPVPLNFSKSIISSHSLELGQQEFFHIRGHSDPSHNVWPKCDWRHRNQLARESDDLKVVVEVLAITAVSRMTCHAWVAFAIMADATNVAPDFIGKENIGAKVECLSNTLEPSCSASQSSQFYRAIYRDEYIGVLWDCLGRCQRAQECYAENACRATDCMHE